MTAIDGRNFPQIRAIVAENDKVQKPLGAEYTSQLGRKTEYGEISVLNSLATEAMPKYSNQLNISKVYGRKAIYSRPPSRRAIILM